MPESKMRIEYPKGTIVILDKGYANQSCVTVVCQSINRLFTTIEANGVMWDVMTDRLTIK